MIRRLSAGLVLAAALALPAVAHATPKPAWCHGGAAATCRAADTAFSHRLGQGSRPYEKAWASKAFGTVTIPRAVDPDCYAFTTTGSVQCFVFYSYQHRYFFVSASVDASQAAHRTAHIYSIDSYQRRWVNCPLGKDQYGQPIPGRLISNNACGNKEGENEAYFIGDEMQGYGGTVRFTREVGWQFTDSGYIASGFFRAVGGYRCTNGQTIVCRDGAGDEFKYIR